MKTDFTPMHHAITKIFFSPWETQGIRKEGTILGTDSFSHHSLSLHLHAVILFFTRCKNKVMTEVTLGRVNDGRILNVGPDV